MKSCKVEDTAEKTATTSKVRDGCSAVYRWASSLVSENLEKGEDKFYLTQFFKSLCFKIENTKKGLITVSGLQGTGKSRILHELQCQFSQTLLIKWTRNWQEDIETWPSVFNQYKEFVKGEVEEEQSSNSIGLMKKMGRKIGKCSIDIEDLSLTQMEAIIGRGRCRELKREALQRFLNECPIFLLDMPDYSKTNVALMNADIDELQQFWESLQNKSLTQIIIAVQKELVMKHPHFFWGKCDMMNLEPLSSDELVEAYKFATEDNRVFDESTLRQLAILSRGVFRRFKKYVRLTIESNLDEEIPIKPEHIEKAVGEKQLFEDMELELCDVFSDREKRLQALSILSFLRNSGNVNIKTVAEAANFTETMTQKILQKLAFYGYVTTKRGVGKEKLVSLHL